MKTFPRLFKKTNTGAIQIWDISSNDGSIITEYGQLDGKIQKTVDVIAKGKNIGKQNETTRSQQADLESEAKWTKQLKKGYCQDLASAQAGAVDEIIESGTIAPMLAPSKIYPIFKDKLTWPVLTQPKLDGSRLIAILKGGKCTLWSRTRKQVNSLPHIAKAVEDQLGKFGDAIYDGEAYNFEYAKQNGFEGLMSVIRKDYPSPESEEIHYYIYDIASLNVTNAERDTVRLDRIIAAKPPLVCVPTAICKTHEDVLERHIINVSDGFEGTMVRSNAGLYEGGKRSYGLQKLKNRLDSEYPILDAEEGRGKDAGTVGAFVCSTPAGKTFKCRLKATYERRRELFNNPEQWKGWKLTVLYQDLTLDGIPRFPIGKALRKSEE